MTQPRLLGGRYELEGVVGRGGMAEVYRARDLRLDRTVAVKTLREDLARDQTFQARFRREAQSAASLNHPSIVAVYDTGEDVSATSHVPFIVMEYVDGRTVRDLLRDDRRLLPDRALEICDGVLRALDYSHRNGIVHRDIKPGNVMLNRSGEIKVMDFGIARAVSDAQATMTQTAQVIGTAQYLSPEQARGERVDFRSDLYSVGCLLYELLTGRPPFTGDSPVAIAYQHVREAPVPPSRIDPDLPSWADPIVLKAMAKDPADRYQTAAEMRADIQRALGGYPVEARMGRPAYAGYAGDPNAGTRRMTAAGPTQVQGRPTGALPPYQYGQPTGRTQTRGKRPIWPWVAGGLALAVIAAAVIVLNLINGHGSATNGTVVPSGLVGKTLSQADQILRGKGLHCINSEAGTVPPGSPQLNIVTSTNPSSGQTVPAGTTAVTCYYKGPTTGAQPLPDVSGDSPQAARSALAGAGWHNVTTSNTRVASLTIPPGSVVSTTPAANSPVPFTSTIYLNLSGGGAQVPQEVIGETQQQAQATLTTYGFTAQPNAIMMADPSGNAAPGTVWKVSPDINKIVLPSTVVTLYVQPSASPSTSSPSPSGTPSGSPSP